MGFVFEIAIDLSDEGGDYETRDKNLSLNNKNIFIEEQKTFVKNKDFDLNYQ